MRLPSGPSLKRVVSVWEAAVNNCFSLLLQIRAYVMCNKLRSAYLVSVRQENTRAVQLVQHVRQLAENSGEDVVQAICAQWLSVHQPKQKSGFTQSTRK